MSLTDAECDAPAELTAIDAMQHQLSPRPLMFPLGLFTVTSTILTGLKQLASERTSNHRRHAIGIGLLANAVEPMKSPCMALFSLALWTM